MPSEPIAVEVLHTPGRGRWEAERDAVLRIAEQEGIAVAFSERFNCSQDEAEALRLPGS